LITTIAVANYRSLRDVIVPLRKLNLLTGSNGSGKSNLYRALRLLAETAQGNVIGSLAREGGLDHVLWAGPPTFSKAMKRGTMPIEGLRRTGPVRLLLGYSTEQFGYSIDLGMPSSQSESTSAFVRDPEIKREVIWNGQLYRSASIMVDRRGKMLRARSSRTWDVISGELEPYESMLSELADPERTPDILMVRQEVRSWRFYDQFRTDPLAPARQLHVGTLTPVLSNDGHDLVAALQTINEIGDAGALASAVDDAFPGSILEISQQHGLLALRLRQRGLLRALETAELSDGTLRYLLWIAALLTPRPPSLMVMNEPETSLHPELLACIGSFDPRNGRANPAPRCVALPTSHQ
jgi:predicted ATPase